MKWLIILLLILLLLVLYSRYKKLIGIIRGQLDRKKTTLPNEIIVDTQRITDATKRENLKQWFLDRGYTEKRVFELAGQVRLHLFNRDEVSSVIDLLTKGDDSEMATYESKVDLEGGSYSDVTFNKYLLFPEQRIEFPDVNNWFKKCTKGLRTRSNSTGRKDRNDNYKQNDSENQNSSGNEQGQQSDLIRDNYCRNIFKAKFRNAPAGSSVDFNQGVGPSSVKVGLIDSKADFAAFASFEELLKPADPYVQYVQDAQNDFGGLNLSSAEAHGTFMASIISEKFDGSSLLKIRSYPFHDGEKGHMIDLLAAIYSAIHEGIDILNLSLGYAQNIRDAHLNRVLEYAGVNDILVVCAAGNFYSNNDSKPFWPANFSAMPHVISVGATDDAGIQWHVNSGEGSNYGEITVSLAALGENLVGFVNATDKMLLSGTSCAAAVVSSAAAGIKSSSPSLSAKELKAALIAQINSGSGIFSSEGPVMV